MTKQEANDIFDSKGEDALDKLLDYILVEQNYNKATKFIMETVGCDETTAKAMVLETIPTNTEQRPIQQQNIPKCPTCNSTNIEKIGGLERGASIVMWGLFSKKINKTFKCKNCGHTW
ncbi:hypothetical protein DW839_31840 [Enterocloster bolteae]|jgi:hypothetical protein|uniref:Uncharacterized protein n=1 Tax=Enterocloster bolteae TaxID=208479 RepID=A0A414AEZ2_9FIRM|nr:hypothetical protein DW839_31840 [Enterocloster bolteae]